MDLPQPPIRGLDAGVHDRIVTELGPAAGYRVLSCLRTADSLLQQPNAGQHDVRYAESAAYNLREALNSVVRDSEGGEGGLSGVMEAWQRYKTVRQLAGADESAARAEFEAFLDQVARDETRQAYMTRKLLAWYRDQTGVDPIPGDDDPAAQYQALRKEASRVVHGDSTVAEVELLFGDTIAWFARLFTPPSHRIDQLVQLARRTYEPELLVELRSLAMNPHHLRLFLERLEDSAWLEPMRVDGLIGLPRPGELWPVVSLVGTARGIDDESVADLLRRVLDEVNQRPKEERASSASEIMRVASRLGTAGHDVALEILRRYPRDHWIQMIAMSIAEEVDVSDPIHLAVADAVIGSEPGHDGGHLTTTALERLVAGMTEETVEERFGLIVAKVRRLANEERARYLFIDIAALSTDGDDPWEPVLRSAQFLAAAVPKARSLGLSSASMLQHVRSIPRELGQRLTCQVLAGATEINRDAKLSHIEERLASETATGDDRALIEELSPLSDSEIDRLRVAFGAPSPGSDGESTAFGDNWPRGWRWSMLLPEGVLAGWQAAIAAVTEVHGAPDLSALNRRSPHSAASWGSSPYSTDDLAGLDVLGAASRIAEWRPRSSDAWGVSAIELARTLEAVVKENPEAWADDPLAIVRALREPVYVDHYFRAIAASAAKVATQAPALLRAVELVRCERWEPAELGRDDFDYEPDWSMVDTASVEMVDALADADADLEADLPLCWTLASQLASSLPDDLGTIDQYSDRSNQDDPLNRAINRAYGKGLRAVLALGGWEHRNTGSASPSLSHLLTEVLAVGGAVGLELRSIVASSRPFVEAIAGDWLARYHDVLFGDALGQVTFDQTLKWSRPTKEFYSHALDRLLDAARRGADNAVAWLLIGYLSEEPGYTFDRIIDGAVGADSALIEIGREIGHLTGDVPPDRKDLIQRGIAGWEGILAEANRRVPASALIGLGTWAPAKNLEERTWLELTERTVGVTGGQIEMVTEVAERCRDAQPSSAGLRILNAVLGQSDTWERHHVAMIGIEALRAARDGGLANESVRQLQDSLLQRGHHDAAAINVGDVAVGWVDGVAP